MRKFAPLLLLLVGAAPAPPAGTITGSVLAVQNGARVTSPYVYVYLRPVKPPVKAPGEGMKFEIHQKGEAFVPNVLVVPRGAVVAFPNDDGNTSHNVFSPTEPHFDLGRANGTESRNLNQKFDDDLAFDIYCDIHQKMWAKVKVVDSTYIAPVKDGSYSFGNVAPGSYQVVAWAPSSTEVMSERITVTDGQTVTPKQLHLQLQRIDVEHTRIDGSPYSVYRPQ